MVAVLPSGHPLVQKDILTLEDLLDEEMILLDEGEYSLPRVAFDKQGLVPKIRYEIYDDNTILEMIRQGLGISLMYERTLDGYDQGLVRKEVPELPGRKVALAWKNRETMSYASGLFLEEILAYFRHRQIT